MSIKDFLMRKMLAAKMKDVPKEEQEKIMNMLENNPQLFEQIAIETQALMKNGKDQMTAVMEVMQKHKDELSKIAK